MPCQTPVPIVPTDVSEEPVTPEPRVVADRTDVPLISNVLPVTRLKSSEEVQPIEDQVIDLSVAPLRVIPPPSAVTSVGVATEPNSIFLSSTVRVVELTVVVVPLTVKSPVIVALPLTAKSVPTYNFLAMPTPPVIITAPVVLEDASVAPESVVFAVTAKSVPTYSFLATPTPPATLSVPVVLEDASVVPASVRMSVAVSYVSAESSVS